MADHRFSVYGVLIDVAGGPGAWKAYLPGPDGKRRAAGLAIPGFLQEDELCQYLADLLHERATPANHRAYRVR